MAHSSTGNALHVSGETGAFEVTLSSINVETDVVLVTVVLEATEAAVPPPITLEWSEPLLDSVAFWHAMSGRFKHLEPAWRAAPVVCRANGHAPLSALVSGAGLNRLCVALSDAVHPMTITTGVTEETAEVSGKIVLLAWDAPAVSRYEVLIRFDRRPVRYEVALGDAARWWEEDCGYGTMPVPEGAQVPLYSTWYTFHQNLTEDALVEECAIASSLGCGAVIIDDGWQTTDSNRGYDYAGDWQPDRLTNMGELVQRLHAVGMKVGLWYAVPFVGEGTKTFTEWRDRLLYKEEKDRAWVFDPRYPSTRLRMVNTLAAAAEDWGLDGFKLDFVNRFRFVEDRVEQESEEQRDHQSITAASLTLMREISASVLAKNANALIEFRQPYTGPSMRGVGNIFRANDCPADIVLNRVSIVDLRLLGGDSTIHSDMLMWHADETAEAAALQLLTVLFSVPQISIRLASLSEPHMQMVRFWLRFWMAHRETLIRGHFRAESPELNYTLLTGFSDAEQISAAYADVVVSTFAEVPSAYVINGKTTRGVAVDLPEVWVGSQAEILDCLGTSVGQVLVSGGLQRIDVPPSGLVHIKRGVTSTV